VGIPNRFQRLTNSGVKRFTQRIIVVCASDKAIQTHDGAPQVQAHGTRDARELRHRFSQQRRFIAIARGRHERRDHVAMSIAEGDDLVAFDLLVTADAEVVASFLRRCGRAIAMNDGGVRTIALSKPEHRAFENGFKTAVRLPPPKGSIDARVVDLREGLRIAFDRQLLPLAAQLEQTQNVVEARVKAQFLRGAATALAQMRQDKMLELRGTQFRWNPLSWLASRHLEHQSDEILAGSLVSAKTPSRCSLKPNSSAERTRNQLVVIVRCASLHQCRQGLSSKPASRTPLHGRYPQGTRDDLR
jgi:hypothetical protein